ncbi:hypothetical protein [Phaeospirillum tilakii]|uniref:Uncharacterized protein n=1 Tax=Phaeospirillum tilakii TaxID=741673 RepID=A0ABW5CBC5_9PROT
MQLRKTSAFALYLGSYLPLSLILFVQDLNLDALKVGVENPLELLKSGFQSLLLHPVWSLTAVGVGAACLLATNWLLNAVKTPHRIRIIEAKHVPADLINYTIPYIVSFMGLDFGFNSKIIGFFVFLFWMFWISYRSGQIFMNPILVVFGWRLYEIKYSHMQSEDQLIGRVLSKVEIEPRSIYFQCRIQDVMIIRS